MGDRRLSLSKLDPPHEYVELKDQIGKGAYGRVYKGLLKNVKKIVAVKIVPIVKEEREAIAVELKILAKFSTHKNIARYYAAYVDPIPKYNILGSNEEQLWLVMQYCAYGTAIGLVTAIRKPKPNFGEAGKHRKPGYLPENVLAFIVRECLFGLEFLHSNKVIHRDIKGQNVLITRDMRIKLVDFGVGALMNDQAGKRDTVIGTPFWMAPEVIECEYAPGLKSYDSRCDIWSMAITAMELADGHAPLYKMKPMKALHKIVKDSAPKLSNANKWSKNFADYLAKSLKKKPKRRARALELTTHPFVANVDEDEARKKLRELVKEYLPSLPSEEYDEWFNDEEENDNRVETMLFDPGKKAPILTKEVEYGTVHRKTDNLTHLKSLDTETLVQVLNKRFQDDIIYTLVGDILVAINPFHELVIYDHKFHGMFDPTIAVSPFPHVFNLAKNAFNNLKHSRQAQCCIISGESGAGKTETAKYFVRHLLFVSGAMSNSNNSLERRITGCNPVLEAFGNAKTVMNGNSSRFGKFLEIQFNNNMTILGATVAQYLLEKSRIITQAPGERNFHVFYYLVTGWKECNEKRALGLSNVVDFSYLGGLSQETQVAGTQLRKKSIKGRQWGKANVMQGRGLSTRAQKKNFKNMLEERKHAQIQRARAGDMNALTDMELMDEDEAEDKYNELVRAMGDITFTSSEILEIKLILSIVLHMGNVSFVTVHDGDHSKVSTPQNLAHVAKLLGVDESMLEDAFTTNVSITRGETITTRLRVHMSEDVRDSSAKVLYDRLFAWIVTRINNVLSPTGGDPSMEVGVLDIFGFEKFKTNSLEQLCINITNEHLQYHFNQHVFVWELEDLKEEGIKIDNITFEDNKPLLDMFLVKGGMLSLIDEESYFPGANDYSLSQKLTQGMKKNKKYFQPPKSHHSTIFTIHHYASSVTYTVESMLEKNRDKFSTMMESLLRDSDVPLIRMLFRYNIGPTGILGNEWQSDADRTRIPTALRSLTPEVMKELQRSGSREKRRSSAEISALSNRKSIRRNYSRKSRRSVGLLGGGRNGKGKKAKTICKNFKSSLVDLMDKLVKAQPQFVRCIKPNSRLEAGLFTYEMVVRQLTYTGLLSTIAIRKQGYPVRLEFREFVNQYQVVAFPMTKEIGDIDLVAACVRILSEKSVHRFILSLNEGKEQYAVRGVGWDVGKCKVFLKPYTLDALQRVIDAITKRAIIIQSQIRMFLCRNLLTRLKREAEERRRREEEERKRKAEEERKRREAAEKERKEREARAKQEAEKRKKEEAKKRKREREKKHQRQEELEKENKEKNEEIEALKRRKVTIRVSRTSSQIESDLKEMEVEDFHRDEYDSLSLRLVKKSKIPPNTAPLNRYMNILPNPRTRVRLEQLGSDKTTSYINANYVHGWDGTPRCYIATQGPTPKTVNDFWRMVWETDSNTIVMVTGLKEKGVVKCARYWPTVRYNFEDKIGDKQYGKVNVAVMEGAKKNGYVTTKLRLIKDGEKRTVMHYWFNSWPDHGVPKKTENVHHMLKTARSWCDDNNKPWVVHCSAGVGRTGTFITIDVGMQHLEHKGKANVVDIIQALRKDRCAMVQHAEQAEFAHKCLKEYAGEYGVEPEALVSENDNKVLAESIIKAQQMVPPSFSVHDSQQVVDEGGEDIIPQWRMLTLKRKEEEDREEIMDIEMEGDIGRKRAQQLRERNQQKDAKRTEAAERLKLIEEGNLDELRRCLNIDIQGGVARTLKKKHDDTMFEFLDSDEDSETDEEGSEDEATLRPKKGRMFNFDEMDEDDEDAFEEEEFFEEESDDYLLQLVGEADGMVKAREPQMDLQQQQSYSDADIRRRSEQERKRSLQLLQLERNDKDEWKYMAPLTWKPRHCADWLRDTIPMLEWFALTMKQHNIIGGDLIKMSDQKLKSLGLTDSRQRKTFKAALKSLRGSTKKGLNALEKKTATLSRGGDLYIAKYSFPGNAGKNQLAINEGDELVKLQEVNSSWFEMRLQRTGVTGLVPASYTEHVDVFEGVSGMELQDPINYVRVIHDALGEGGGQLIVHVGDELGLLKRKNAEWIFARNIDGEIGMVRSSNVEDISVNRKMYVLRDYMNGKRKLAMTKGDTVTQIGWTPEMEMIVDSPLGRVNVDRSYVVEHTDGYGFHREMEAVLDYPGGDGKLLLSAGDKIQALSLVSSTAWLYAFHQRTATFGYVPLGYVRDMAEETVPMRVISAYNGEGRKGVISLQAGEQVEMLKKVNESWCVVETSSGRRGMFPSGNLERISAESVTEVMRLTHAFTAADPPNFVVKIGDPVTVLQKTNPDWYFVRRIDGLEAMVPSQYLQQTTVFYQAIADFRSGGNSSQQLNFQKHDIFVLLAFRSTNWLQARDDSHRIGLVPVDYVRELSTSTPFEGKEVAPVERGHVASRLAHFSKPRASEDEDSSPGLRRRASVGEGFGVSQRKQAFMRHTVVPSAWSVEHVQEWLLTLSMDTSLLESVFALYGVDGQKLLSLDDSALRSMSISDAKMRRNLLQEVRNLNSLGEERRLHGANDVRVGQLNDPFRARAATAGIAAQLHQMEEEKGKKKKKKKDYALRMAEESRRRAQEEEERRERNAKEKQRRLMFGTETNDYF
eukprot:m.121670 g.121670  ORF g.121670 m.121670 type:complete len:2603 (-) comp12926_c0_seq1:157-7965(-)